MLDYQVISLFAVAIISALFSYVISGKRGEKSKRTETTLFSLIAIFIGLWALNISFFIQQQYGDFTFLFVNAYYVSAAFIPLLFFYFAVSYVNDKHIKLVHNVICALPLLFLIGALLVDPYFLITSITPQNSGVTFNIPVYIAYSAYFFVFIVWTYSLLVYAFVKEKNTIQRVQLKLIIIGTLVSFLLGLFFNLILPWFNIYEHIWLGPVFSLIFVFSMGYAIIRHNLFNIKVVTTKILVFGLLFFIFVRFLIAENLENKITESVLFLVTTIAGLFIIRNVMQEIQVREEAEKLAEQLRKANARLRELDRQKSEFVSIASHQLRTPLTAIKGYSSMLLDGSFGKMCKGSVEPVEKIYRSSQRLVGVVEDFLNVTRIEQGRMSYDFRPVDMHHICENVVEELSFGAKDKGLDLIFKCGKPGAIVSADQGKIRQVALNLVDNAVKYTEKGEVEVCLRDDDPKHVVFEVVDTGIGIPEEFKKRMFEKFSRADNSGAYHANGSGIGLYIVKEIVEAHKGTVSVDSKEGKGATFTVTLPRVKEETKG